MYIKTSPQQKITAKNQKKKQTKNKKTKNKNKTRTRQDINWFYAENILFVAVTLFYNMCVNYYNTHGNSKETFWKKILENWK